MSRLALKSDIELDEVSMRDLRPRPPVNAGKISATLTSELDTDLKTLSKVDRTGKVWPLVGLRHPT